MPLELQMTVRQGAGACGNVANLRPDSSVSFVTKGGPRQTPLPWSKADSGLCLAAPFSLGGAENWALPLTFPVGETLAGTIPRLFKCGVEDVGIGVRECVYGEKRMNSRPYMARQIL